LTPPEAPLPEAPFDEPWQAQVFALAVHLHQAGAFTWTEWAAVLATEIATHGDAPYYDSWLAALETLATGKRLAGADELIERKADWARAYLATPHGEPVELSAARGH
jgi:nitrile hydratase accessory protein